MIIRKWRGRSRLETSSQVVFTFRAREIRSACPVMVLKAPVSKAPGSRAIALKCWSAPSSAQSVSGIR
jgi:hypothetical protein